MYSDCNGSEYEERGGQRKRSTRGQIDRVGRRMRRRTGKGRANAVRRMTGDRSCPRRDQARPSEPRSDSVKEEDDEEGIGQSERDRKGGRGTATRDINDLSSPSRFAAAEAVPGGTRLAPANLALTPRSCPRRDQARPSEPRSDSVKEEDDEEGIGQSERDRKGGRGTATRDINDLSTPSRFAAAEAPKLSRRDQARPSEPRSDSVKEEDDEEGIGQSERDRKGGRGTATRDINDLSSPSRFAAAEAVPGGTRLAPANLALTPRSGPRRDQARPSEPRSDSVKEEDDEEGIGQSERDRKGGRGTATRDINDLSTPSRFAAAEAPKLSRRDQARPSEPRSDSVKEEDDEEGIGQSERDRKGGRGTATRDINDLSSPSRFAAAEAVPGGNRLAPANLAQTPRSGPRRDQARPSEPRSDSVKEEDDEEGIGQSERDRKGGRGTATRDINDLSSPSRFAAAEAVPGGTRLAPANLAQTPRSGPRRDQARPSEPRSDSVKEEDDEEGIGQSERDRKGGRGTATRDINDLSSPSRFAAAEAVPGGTRLAPANLALTPRSCPRRDQARPSEPRSDSVKEEDDEEGIGQSERDRKGGRGTATRDINDLSTPSRFAAAEAVPGGTRLAPANLALTP
ncbi:hypothetical protein D9C73_028128 [Collichthys lucidus]|uniref:Uncharacterized protein n=1 Tax=Collichthys lucidus TaxID=240159 RepID=A0A4V6ALP8_COLLU|nr:hypothetical protein D9C73_028128 [Collichthys lucidus]